MTKNEYIPFRSEILEVIEHTPIEYTFRMAFNGDVKPGQFPFSFGKSCVFTSSI